MKLLKIEYDSINIRLNETKKEFIKTIQPYFGLKENVVEKIITEVFETDIYTFLEKKELEIMEISTPLYTNIIYNEVFNDKAAKFLSEKSFNLKIKEYIVVYDRLVNDSSKKETSIIIMPIMSLSH